MHNTIQIICVGFFLLFFEHAATAKTVRLDRPHKADELIVKFQDRLSSKYSEQILTSLGATILYKFRSNGAYQANFPLKGSDQSLKELAQKLVRRPDVVYVEPNFVTQSLVTFPNDARFSEQYSLYQLINGTKRTDISAPEAWDITTGSRKILVAVIDTGLDYTHPELAQNAWTNPGETGLDSEGRDRATNGIDDDKNGFVDDWRGWNFEKNNNNSLDNMVDGHGSHCSGIIGASGNNGDGIAGINWEVSLVGIRFLDDRGAGYVADGAKSVEYATLIQADILSNSWGNEEYSQTLYAALKVARDKGILVVAAAGNSSHDADAGTIYPAGYYLENMLAVAATNEKDELADFSNFGRTNIHLAAPGVEILSLRPWEHKFANMSGTSMAAPHVSGVAALIKAAYPDASLAQIRRRILNNVDILPSLQDKVLSNGRLNAFRALEFDEIMPNAVTEIDITAVSPTSLMLSWYGAGDDGDVGDATEYEARYSKDPIVSEEDWKAARKLPLTISEKITNPGRHPFFKGEVRALPINDTGGYVAIRAIDNVGNFGDLSRSLSYVLPKANVIYENPAESMEGIAAQGPWGLERDDERGGMVFSDSPGSAYEDSINYAMTLPIITVKRPSATLTFMSYYTFDKDRMFGDFGFLEISIDGGTEWKLVKKVTGLSAGWVQEIIKLDDFLGQTRTFQLRFRVATDWSEVRDGWLIDDVVIYASE